jgi:hypothetical protein
MNTILMPWEICQASGCVSDCSDTPQWRWVKRWNEEYSGKRDLRKGKKQGKGTPKKAHDYAWAF